MTITRRGLHSELELLDDEIAKLQSEKADCFAAYREQLEKAGFQGAQVTDEIACCKMAFRQLRALKKNPTATAARHELVDEIVAEIKLGTDDATHARVREPKPPRTAAPPVETASTASMPPAITGLNPVKTPQSSLLAGEPASPTIPAKTVDAGSLIAAPAPPAPPAEPPPTCQTAVDLPPETAPPGAEPAPIAAETPAPQPLPAGAEDDDLDIPTFLRRPFVAPGSVEARAP
jgi:hypothetical protein